MKITMLKTRKMPLEEGESYDPATDVDPTVTPAPVRDRTQSYTQEQFDRDRRRKLAQNAQLEPGETYVENQAPTFRQDLADLIGQDAADLAIDWTPAYGFDWLDRMNYATMGARAGNSKRDMLTTAGEGLGVAGATAALNKWGMPLLKKAWNTVNPGANWFDNPLAWTKFVDESGAPRTAYRGEHGTPPPGGGFQSRVNSLAFGTQDAANLYATKPNVWTDVPQAPRVTAAHLDMRNPLFDSGEEDPFVDLSELIPKLGDDIVRKFALEHADSIENTNNWEENFAPRYDSVAELLAAEPQRLNELYLHAHDLLDNPAFVEAAKAKGYDSAMHGGTGETFDQPEYRIFDQSQAISPYSQTNQFALPKQKRK